jgi:hypothetical protein
LKARQIGGTVRLEKTIRITRIFFVAAWPVVGAECAHDSSQRYGILDLRLPYILWPTTVHSVISPLIPILAREWSI